MHDGILFVVAPRPPAPEDSEGGARCHHLLLRSEICSIGRLLYHQNVSACSRQTETGSKIDVHAWSILSSSRTNLCGCGSSVSKEGFHFWICARILFLRHSVLSCMKEGRIFFIARKNPLPRPLLVSAIAKLSWVFYFFTRGKTRVVAKQTEEKTHDQSRWKAGGPAPAIKSAGGRRWTGRHGRSILELPLL